MKRILIWNTVALTNTGGPKGYLYNIHEAIKGSNYDITFLSDLIPPKDSNKSNKTEAGIIFHILKDIKHVYSLCWGYFHQKRIQLPKDVSIDDYDIIHIHQMYDVFTFKRSFPDYQGKLILTTHSPCPWTDEMLSHEDRLVKLFRPIILKWECKAYDIVDYIMFPCRGARDPYEKEPKIKSIFTKNENKFFYVPSAILDLSINEEKMQSFKEFGIPDNAFVISYFGRHNYIKGYDILKIVGRELLDKHPNLYIICGGRGDIKPFKHNRWIELGFINNTHELLYQSDLYISANRETYFDLVVLEILRSSTKLILSSTGGNNYFKDLPCKYKRGLLFFDINNTSELVNLVEKCIKEKETNPDMYQQDCESNRQLYLEHFTPATYLKNYTIAIESL